jgi:hypothetical protein
MNHGRVMNWGKGRGALASAGAFLGCGAVAALVAVACSSLELSGAEGTEAGSFDGACGPLPESLSVAGLSDCVATIPNPCCTGFYAFSCAAPAANAGQGEEIGGDQCSETSTCVRAARYDQSLCLGAEAYSCPDLSGTNYATMTTPSCEQMEAVGPAGEGIRWCCGPNLPPVQSLDAAAPPPSDDAGALPDAPVSTDDSSLPPPQDSSMPPPADVSVPPPQDSAPPPTKDSSAPPVDASPSDATMAD